MQPSNRSTLLTPRLSMTLAPINEGINGQSLESLPDRCQENSSLPVFRLLPEILAEIFVHCAREHYEFNQELDSYRCDTSYRVPDWVNVSYVCRHWRDVALSCPTLWAYHFTISRRWTEELLARSKQALLNICILWCPWDSWEMPSWMFRIILRVLDHTERIQDLRLSLPHVFFPKFNPLSLYAPHLQTLHLDGGFSTQVVEQGDIPPLRTLKITSCRVSWHSTFNLSGVTTLFLRYYSPPPQLDVMVFLATLSRMQALTVLHIHHALPSARDLLSSRSYSPKTVSLPRLARLFTIIPHSTIAVLLSCIDIPPKTQLWLVAEPEDGACTDDYSQLASALAKRFNRPTDHSTPGPAIRSLHIRFCGCGFLLVTSGSERADFDPTVLISEAYHDVPLVIHVPMKRPIDRIRDGVVTDMCRAIPSTHVQTLFVLSPPSSPDFWAQVWGHFGGLRRVKLSKGFLPDLVPSFGDGDPTPRVPSLKALELHCIIFMPDGHLSLRSLFGALSSRKAFSPQCIDMIGCIVGKNGDDDAPTIFTGQYLYDSFSGKYRLGCKAPVLEDILL